MSYLERRLHPCVCVERALDTAHHQDLLLTRKVKHSEKMLVQKLPCRRRRWEAVWSGHRWDSDHTIVRIVLDEFPLEVLLVQECTPNTDISSVYP